MEEIETRTMAKVLRRLIPLAIICYFVNYLDRVNLSFAALQMNKDLGFSSTVYGFGAGVFFIAYFLLETPSNLILVRVGARRWIARIMFTWGLLSGAMAFVQGETSFYVLRFLLGAAEAGFFPGMLFYLSLYFPGVLSRAHGQHLHGGHCILGGVWRAGVEHDPVLHGRSVGTSRLAVGVHRRGGSGADPVGGGLDGSEGYARRGDVAGAG